MDRDGEKIVKLTFDDMIGGTTVLIPDAFAIVNAADTSLNITGLEVGNVGKMAYIRGLFP